jgi:hypothetical protein
MPGFNLFQCGLSSVGAFRTGELTGLPWAGAATAVGNILTNPNCGLTGAAPGTYTSTSTAPNGPTTTVTNFVGNPGQNSWTNITTVNPDGSSTSNTYNADGTSSSSYTPPIPNLGPLSYDSVGGSADDASGGLYGASDGYFGADGGGDSGGGGGADQLLMC